jgi:hypothetical protein
MTAQTSTQDRAREAAEWFEVAERVEGDEDSRYIRTKDGCPEWVTQLVYSAHGDFLPDDWRYNVIQDALEAIAESDDPEDAAGEFADSAVDVYTHARLKWLASNLNRAAYCDEAAQEFGAEGSPDIISMIGLGQYYEASEVYGLVLRALEDA